MKKALSILSVLLSLLLLFPAFGAIGSFADPDEETEVTVETKEVNAYVFTLEDTKNIVCAFRSDLPDVLYIEPTDYLNVIYTDEFTGEKQTDGTFTVVTAYGDVMTIDPQNDTVYFENYDSFTSCQTNQEGSSVELNYFRYLNDQVIAESQPVTLDLAGHGIDIIEVDGKVYLPLTVISSMFAITYNNANYLDGNLCFVHTFDPESYYDELDQSSLFEKTERTPEMAAFSYGTLCFTIDYFYGRPSGAYLADFLEEMSLDEALENCDENTRLAKQLLLSTDMIDCFNGYSILAWYLHDGGHTCISNIPVLGVNFYSDTPLASGWYAKLQEDSDESNLVWALLSNIFDDFDYSESLAALREDIHSEDYPNEVYKTYEPTENGDTPYLLVHGNTAVFVFDSFAEDTPNTFLDALQCAKELGVKNFVLDDSCNGGGYVAAYLYITALITNGKYHDHTITDRRINPLTGFTVEDIYELDLNLDGEFDEKDDEICFDFNFAIVTSYGSFSAGNQLPVEAQQRGILILGECSGGGSCHVTERFTAEGFCFPISDLGKSIKEDGTDVDNGAEPDFELVYLGDDGYYHYGPMYDIDNIAQIMEAYYAENPYVVDTGVDPLPVLLLVVSLLGVTALIAMKRRRSQREN